MANTVITKYSAITAIPTSLGQGEQAYSEVGGNTFIGYSDGSVVVIGGARFVTKLNGIDVGANNYSHPSNHSASMITQSVGLRFVSDTEKSNWNSKASTAVVTTSANGLMSNTDKSKLNGMSSGANNYSHPSGSGYSHIPAGGTSGQILVNAGDGIASWANNVGAVSSVNGQTGVVTLDKEAIGLGSVDNTADSSKNVLSATKLTTARTIAGVSFNGTSNISLSLLNLGTDSTHRTVTDAEKSNWNASFNWFNTMTASDGDNVINTVNEIISSFSGNNEGFNIASELANPTGMTLDGGTF